MLQGLELADRLAELLARLEVVERGLVDGDHDADGLRAQRRVGDIERPFDDRHTFALGADQSVLGHLDVVELDLCGASAVLRAIATRGDAGGRAIDQEQRDALGIAGLARRARRDDQLVGALALQDDALGAVENVAPPSGRAVEVTAANS